MTSIKLFGDIGDQKFLKSTAGEERDLPVFVQGDYPMIEWCPIQPVGDGSYIASNGTYSSVRIAMCDPDPVSPTIYAQNYLYLNSARTTANGSATFTGTLCLNTTAVDTLLTPGSPASAVLEIESSNSATGEVATIQGDCQITADGIKESTEDVTFPTLTPVRLMYAGYGYTPVTNTAVETSLIPATGLGTLTVPAGFLTAGKMLRIRGLGRIAATGAVPLSLFLLLGETTLQTALAVPTSTMGAWFEVEAVVICEEAGAAGQISGYLQFQWGYITTNSKRCALATASTPTIVDTTVALQLGLTAQWGSADAGCNVSLRSFTVEVL